jgi:hypothetical protein
MLAAQLRRLSELTGNSQSKLLAEMLEGSTVVFERLITILEAAAEAKQSLHGKVAEDMGHAQDRIEKQLGLILDDFDRATLPLLADAEKVSRRSARSATPSAARGRRGGGSPSPTPLSNRGVRSLTTATQNIAPGQSTAKDISVKRVRKSRGVE